MTGKTPKAVTIRVRTPSRNYSVRMGAGVLRESGQWIRGLQRDCARVFVVSSPAVYGLWGKELEKGLRKARIRPEVLLIDDRERAKRPEVVTSLAQALQAGGADRGSLIAAFGGGVVGDVAGYAAATYMRGISYVQIPTTLVAQVDSSIGGKTGVNLGGAKNLVGAFHQPLGVLADTRTLCTLPSREFRNGLYEVVKSAVIGDARLFAYLERNLEHVRSLDPAAVLKTASAAARVKAAVVSRDEREAGVRRVLNFGHTFGHAWEALAGFKRLRHGEAVGWGMLAATVLAEQADLITGPEAERITSLVASVGRLPALPDFTPDEVVALMAGDKKARGGKLTLVLPERVGKVRVVDDVPRSAVLGTLRALSV